MRGFGLPGCASGVTVPTSTLPKPSAPKASMQRPFLSSPAARPMRLGKRRPASVTGIVDAALGDGVDQRRVLDRRHRAEGEVVRVLGVEPEQERPGEGIGKKRHGAAILASPVAYSTPSLHRLLPLAGAAAEHDRAAHRERHLRRHRRAGRSPLGRADPALAAPLRHLDREDAARADPRAGAGQAQRRASSTASSARSIRRRPTRSSPPPTRCSPASTTASSRSRSGRPARARRAT